MFFEQNLRGQGHGAELCLKQECIEHPANGRDARGSSAFRRATERSYVPPSKPDWQRVAFATIERVDDK